MRISITKDAYDRLLFANWRDNGRPCGQHCALLETLPGANEWDALGVQAPEGGQLLRFVAVRGDSRWLVSSSQKMVLEILG